MIVPGRVSKTSLLPFLHHLTFPSLVRCLVLSTYAHENETTVHQIELLRMCPLVEDVKIHGYNGWLLNQYRPVVASLSNLRTLNISRYSLSLD